MLKSVRAQQLATIFFIVSDKFPYPSQKKSRCPAMNASEQNPAGRYQYQGFHNVPNHNVRFVCLIAMILSMIHWSDVSNYNTPQYSVSGWRMLGSSGAYVMCRTWYRGEWGREEDVQSQIEQRNNIMYFLNTENKVGCNKLIRDQRKRSHCKQPLI